MSNNKGANKFNLLEVISLMIITGIATFAITYSVSFLFKDTKTNVVAKSELSELIDTYEEIKKEYYQNLNKKELIDAGIKGMLDYLDDPYSTYLDEDEADEFYTELEGEFVGLGVEIVKKDKDVVIVKILDNSPAEKIGLKPNDIIIKVNGESTAFMDINDLSKKIKGEKGTKTKITITRNGKEKELEFTRDTVTLQSVEAEVLKKGKKKIGYIIVSSFANNTFEQFQSKLNELKKQKIEGIIIDLRGNTGGYLETATKFLEAFIDKGKVIYQLELKGNVEKIYSEKDKSININTVLLVNGGSASASEVLTAGLNENQKIPVVGTNTYGKGKVQKTKTLSSGAIVKYTIESWLTPKGNQIDGKGIKPTYEVSLTKKYVDNPTKENDSQLQKAIEVLLKNS